MNRLWVRLTLAFGLVTLVGLVTVALLAARQVNTQFRHLVASNQMMDSALLDDLARYYAASGNWGGVEGVLNLHPPAGGMGPGPGMMRRGMPGLVLADASGTVVYGMARGSAARLSRQERARAVPIESQQQTVGYLVVRAPEQVPLSAPDRAFLAQITRSLIQAGLIAGGLGLVLGLAIARGLAAPLGQLATAARRISTGKFDRRVPERGAAEVAELARAFNHMAGALEQAETLRRHMVADVAHELRTPLSVLQGNLRAILDDVYPLAKPEIARLYDQTRLLNRLVDDLRELAQAEAGQLQLNKQSTNLSRLIQNTLATFQPVAGAAGVTLDARLPAPLPPVNADPARIAQVLHNLLANALRHTPAGGKVLVTAGVEEARVWLRVTDTGEGIPPYDLPHVFDRFYRADRARSRATGGAGLGLAIVRAIVEAHGGEVTAAVRPAPEHGSLFTVYLPRP